MTIISIKTTDGKVTTGEEKALSSSGVTIWSPNRDGVYFYPWTNVIRVFRLVNDPNAKDDDTPWVAMDIADAADELGTAIHTGLRKGTNGPHANIIWHAISDDNTETWSQAIEWALERLMEANIRFFEKEKS